MDDRKLRGALKNTRADQQGEEKEHTAFPARSQREERHICQSAQEALQGRS
jgi:hypothetical protein